MNPATLALAAPQGRRGRSTSARADGYKSRDVQRRGSGQSWLRHTCTMSRSRSRSPPSRSAFNGDDPALAGQLPVIYNGVYGLRPGRARPRVLPAPTMVVQAVGRPSVPGDPGPRDVRRHVRQLAGALAAALRHGYCVFALNYGSYDGSGAARRLRDRRRSQPSAQQLSSFVDRVLAATGASQGRPGRPLAGRDDAALLPQVPGRRRQGAHAGRPGPVQPRHHAERPLHAGRLLPGANASLGRLPRVRGAGGGLVVHHQPQRRRRHGAGHQLHGDRVSQRRGRHSVHLGLPGRRAERHQHPAPGAVLARSG